MEERFNKFVTDPNENGCRLWTGAKNNKGYGVFRIHPKTCLSHRISFELHNGLIAKGQVVRHTCDVPACVEPTHLIIGTHTDNMRDARDRGRNVPPPVHLGEDQHLAKLNSAQVLEIKQQPDIPRKELANRYNVSIQCIDSIRGGRTWKHIVLPI